MVGHNTGGSVNISTSSSATEIRKDAGPGSYSTSLAMTSSRQRGVMRDFRGIKCNVLFSTNVCAEGVDIPSCNIVVYFGKYSYEEGKVKYDDKEKNLVEYIQSRGRGRTFGGLFVHLVVDEIKEEHVFKESLAKFKSGEREQMRIAQEMTKVKKKELKEKIKHTDHQHWEKKYPGDSPLITEKKANCNFSNSIRLFYPVVDRICKLLKIFSIKIYFPSETEDYYFSSSDVVGTGEVSFHMKFGSEIRSNLSRLKSRGYMVYGCDTYKDAKAIVCLRAMKDLY
jgi:hypothetical protein